MPLPKTPEEWTRAFLRILKFGAQAPLAGLGIAATGCFAFVLFMVLFRTVQWMWIHWLSHPW